MTHQPGESSPHPLDKFKARAAVDWLRVRLTTPRPTQFRHLLAALPRDWSPFVAPLDANRNSCSNWHLTIHDPPHASAITQVLRGLDIDAQRAEVVAMEVAIDWYPASPAARGNLAQVAHHLFKHLARPPNGRGRITEQRSYRAAARPHDTLRALSDGYTVNMGAKDQDHRARVYVKRHDSSPDSAYAPLPEDLHRARIEVTLSDDATPVKDLQALASFRFESLAPYFHLRTVRPDMTANPHFVAQMAQLGRPDSPKLRAGHRRLHHNTTVADSPTNKRVYDALRLLTKASRRAGISDR